MATKTSHTLRSRQVISTMPSSIPVPARQRTEMPSVELVNTGDQAPRMPSPHDEEIMPSDTLEKAPQGEISVPDNVRAASTDVEDDSSDSGSDDSKYHKDTKRAQSLDSADRIRKSVQMKSKTLSTDQEKTVEAATELLTDEQKEQIAIRQEKIRTQSYENNQDEFNTSQNRNKGKTID